eukprot:5299769-Alexandrium_andersonii.AAC.1
MASAVGLLAELHYNCRQMLEERMGTRHEGLYTAARVARSRGLITNQLAKQVQRLDVAFGVMRHLGPVKAKDFCDQLSAALFVVPPDAHAAPQTLEQ